MPGRRLRSPGRFAHWPSSCCSPRSGLGTDFALALAFVCASSASAVLPVAPAGAAVQAGAGAAILVASGVRTEDAVAFGVAAQGLAIVAGAACVLGPRAWHLQGRLVSARAS